MPGAHYPWLCAARAVLPLPSFPARQVFPFPWKQPAVVPGP
ncbi:hypothetical protein M105_4912 [Bacteroides fragilis str. 1009-4-F |nr:hypothetical protein M105_4912 [Bacteroides fragilis str. 1009-4-F \